MADTTTKKDDKASKSDDSKGHVIDVSRPGTAKPSATSRPVIVGSGKIMQDPMVIANNTDEKASGAEPADTIATPPTGSNRIIQPLNDTAKDSDEDKDEAKTKESNDEKVDEKTDDSSAEKTEEKPVEDISKTDDTKETTSQEPKPDKEKSSENAIVDAVVDQTASKKKNTTGQETETTDDRYQSLIDEKKYFVTVGKHRKQRTEAVVISISLLAIIATVVVVANQYGYISLW